MALPAVLTMTIALAAAAGGDRLLLCRPKVTGDPALARGDALLEAARRSGRFLDYGVVCEDVAESARAARRMGLLHAVSVTIEGRVDGSRYQLVLADSASEAERVRRAVDVAPGADAVASLRAALARLADAVPATPDRRPARVAAWVVAGAGAAALAAGIALASEARAAASRASAARDPAGYTSARSDWRDRRRASGVLLGAGGAALAAGLAWRFAF